MSLSLKDKYLIRLSWTFQQQRLYNIKDVDWQHYLAMVVVVLEALEEN